MRKYIFFLFTAIILTTSIHLSYIGCDDILKEHENLFKIDKLNLIYNKAKNSLGETKLKDLRTDFFSLQQDEATLKKIKATNKDKDGLHEAAVRRKFLSVLTKYGLDKYYHDIHPPVDSDDEKNIRKRKILAKVTDGNHETDAHINQRIFRDSRLDKLWKKAEKSGFTQEELMVLHEEFEHQQDKLDEHYETMNFIDIKSDEMKFEQDRWENSIENSMEDHKNIFRSKTSDSESPSDKKNRLSQNVHQTLKDKYKEIKKGYADLHDKVLSGKLSNEENFDEEKVNELWSSAQDANFTSGELDDLRDELYHYQIRIKKLRHYEVQLEHGQANSEISKEDDHEIRDIKKRVKDMNYKVDKIHKTIENKITARRIEL